MPPVDEQRGEGSRTTGSLPSACAEPSLLPGQVRAGQGATAKEAISYFKLALANNVYDFIEHRYALLELELMARKPCRQVPRARAAGVIHLSPVKRPHCEQCCS